MFNINDINTVKKLFEEEQRAKGESFSQTNLFVHMRDTFYGNIKYGDGNTEEIYQMLVDEPILSNDIEYTFASAYTA